MYTLMPPEPSTHPAAGARRMGGLMLAVCWIVVIGLLSMLFTGHLEGQYNPNQRVQSGPGASGDVQVRLRENRQGHYVASGQINDAPVVFLVDTGATDVSVPAGLATRLGLRRGARMAARTANGTVETWRTTLDLVRLGGIELRAVRASINPGMQGDEVLLGMSFLRELDFSQRDGELTLSWRPPG